MGKAKKPRGFKTSKQVQVGEELECEDPKNKKIGLCTTDLPKVISIDILLKLPLNCVLICRCVCKTWRNLIKDPEFVKLHFSQAETYPLIRKVGPPHVSRILYFVDQPPKYKPCTNPECKTHYSHSNNCENHVNMKLNTKLKIPLHNAELVMNGEMEAITNTNLSSKRKRVTKLKPKDHRLKLVNFCNGFLCLAETKHNDPVMVCNPITGQFIKLPLPTKSDRCYDKYSDCGFGFCIKTNKYRVVRTFDEKTSVTTSEPITGRKIYSSRVAEIHTLGTNTWKIVGYAPCPLVKLGFPTCLNGTINWLYVPDHYTYDDPYYIASFDFGEEKFRSIPLPPRRQERSCMEVSRISIGELRGCLCVCDDSNENVEEMELWVMKTYGDESSWNLEFTIDTTCNQGSWLHGIYIPISHFKNGTLLFFHPLTTALFLYDPEEKCQPMKFLKIFGGESIFEAIAYKPSFVALEDTVVGDNVEVYNVNSRCGGLTLQGESATIYLAEEDEDKAFDFNKNFDFDRKNLEWWLK